MLVWTACKLFHLNCKFCKFFHWNKNGENEIETEKFGFKSKNCQPQCKELQNFEKDLYYIITCIKYRRSEDCFQTKMKGDISKIKASPNVLVFTDKTTNIYQLSPSKYNKLLNDNATKTYKKFTNRLEKSINMEAKYITKSISLGNRIECQAKTPAFITLKDHKDNFRTSHPCRLIDLCKSKLGKVSKNILEKANCALIHSLQENQWRNTDSVITWFSSIKQKTWCTFIQLDIMEFYPLITENILDMTIGFPQEHNIFTEKDLRIVKHCRKSLLCANNEPWKKKNIES